MISVANIEKTDKGWLVRSDYGIFGYTLGPYRWRWQALIVAWLEGGNR